jgi:alkaline phosphatase
MTYQNNGVQLSRRAFLKGGALVLTSTTFDQPLSAMGLTETELSVGVVTDLHYADKPPAGSRHYRETLAKLGEAAELFRKQKPDFLVELGDFVDAADSVAVELGYLKRVNRDFSAICRDRHYVLGNHCVDTLVKQEFLDGVEQQRSYYSFDRGNFHFVVLDACFRSDGEPYGRKNFVWTDANIPSAELEWLAADLKATQKKTLVFAHQRLDVATNYGVKNGVEVRKVLEKSGKVLAVLQGHNHKNELRDIGGIHYCTMVAMVEGRGAENSGYSMMKLANDGTIRIEGFRKQADYRWPS